LKALCHCLTCRKITSSTSAITALIPQAQFDATTSSPHYRTYTTVHEAGIPLTVSFCANCSSACWKTAEGGWPGVVIVFAGTLDGDGQKGGVGDINPDAELWVKHRVPWLKGLGSEDVNGDDKRGVTQFQGFPDQ
jgi:hypothetical protein